MAWKWKRHPSPLAENSITEGVIWKNLLFFFFPIMLGSCFQQLYNTVDSIIVGKFVGKEALAAVGGPAASIINLIVGFFIGFSSGATVVLSQCYGGRKDREVGQAVHTAFALAIACGALQSVSYDARNDWNASGNHGCLHELSQHLFRRYDPLADLQHRFGPAARCR